MALAVLIFTTTNISRHRVVNTLVIGIAGARGPIPIHRRCLSHTPMTSVFSHMTFTCDRKTNQEHKVLLIAWRMKLIVACLLVAFGKYDDTIYHCYGRRFCSDLAMKI